jgi:hypothetical protein
MAKKTVTRKTRASSTPKQTRRKKRSKSFVARPLCFTTSYNRPYHLYNCINNILNCQSYKNIQYVVGICLDNDSDKILYQKLLEDFIKDPRLNVFYHPNLTQHDNYLYPIKSIDHNKYNLFIKIDDDDIYKSQYLDATIKSYSAYQTDIISVTTKHQIDQRSIIQGSFDSVGGVWKPDVESDIKFGMPFSYAFNNKALDIILKLTQEEMNAIHPFEDPCWRTAWRKHGLKSYVVSNMDNAIYHLHNSNISSSQREQDHSCNTIESDFCDIVVFKHNYWESYVILNKRNNRMYNIDNDDHGSFEIIDEHSIKIIWDNWGEEIFFKHRSGNKSFFYSI